MNPMNTPTLTEEDLFQRTLLTFQLHHLDRAEGPVTLTLTRYQLFCLLATIHVAHGLPQHNPPVLVAHVLGFKLADLLNNATIARQVLAEWGWTGDVPRLSPEQEMAIFRNALGEKPHA